MSSGYSFSPILVFIVQSFLPVPVFNQFLGREPERPFKSGTHNSIPCAKQSYFGRQLYCRDRFCNRAKSRRDGSLFSDSRRWGKWCLIFNYRTYMEKP
jgi:hypothetical protein